MNSSTPFIHHAAVKVALGGMESPSPPPLISFVPLSRPHLDRPTLPLVIPGSNFGCRGNPAAPPLILPTRLSRLLVKRGSSG